MASIYSECEGDLCGTSGGYSENSFGDGCDVYETTISQNSNKRGRRNSNQSLSEKNNVVQKCSNGGSVAQKEEKNHKKFPHSTRKREKRRFDRTLLTIPDDEIDHPNIPFRDLIRLAEYNEGGEMPKKKDQVVAPANQSLGGDYYNEKFGTYDNVEEQVEEENTVTVADSPFMNYHTFMEKSSTFRWSKQETLLFYEGVRQFGTDISMIQQLFPNRTRRQVKLKYKNEGSRYPQRLDDALMYRSKDVFHFEQVIQRLQEENAAAAASSENVIAEDDEIVSPQQDAASPVDDANVEEANDSAGFLEMDDEILWSQYKSD